MAKDFEKSARTDTQAADPTIRLAAGSRPAVAASHKRRMAAAVARAEKPRKRWDWLWAWPCGRRLFLGRESPRRTKLARSY